MDRRVETKEQLARAVHRSGRTLERWEKDESLGFPKPIIIKGRKFWFVDERIAWMEKQREFSNKAA